MTMEVLLMVREWLIGGSRYGPHGENLGPVSSVWSSRQNEPEFEPLVVRGESTLTVVIEGRLDTANGSGLRVRLWGCGMRISWASIMALETSPL